MWLCVHIRSHIITSSDDNKLCDKEQPAAATLTLSTLISELHRGRQGNAQKRDQYNIL